MTLVRDIDDFISQKPGTETVMNYFGPPVTKSTWLPYVNVDD